MLPAPVSGPAPRLNRAFVPILAVCSAAAGAAAGFIVQHFAPDLAFAFGHTAYMQRICDVPQWNPVELAAAASLGIGLAVGISLDRARDLGGRLILASILGFSGMFFCLALGILWKLKAFPDPSHLGHIALASLLLGAPGTAALALAHHGLPRHPVARFLSFPVLGALGGVAFWLVHGRPESPLGLAAGAVVGLGHATTLLICGGSVGRMQHLD